MSIDGPVGADGVQGPVGGGAATPTELAIQVAYDTYVREDAPNIDLSFYDNMQTSAAAPYRRAILAYADLSALVGKTIISAALKVTKIVAGLLTPTMSVYRVLAANGGWVEACNWNYAKPASAKRWAGDVGSNGGSDAGCSIAGIDYYAVAEGSVAMPSTDPAGTLYSIALDLSQFQAQVAANYGWMMSVDIGLRYIATREHATVAYRPYLVVTCT